MIFSSSFPSFWRLLSSPRFRRDLKVHLRCFNWNSRSSRFFLRVNQISNPIFDCESGSGAYPEACG